MASAHSRGEKGDDSFALSWAAGAAAGTAPTCSSENSRPSGRWEVNGTSAKATSTSSASAQGQRTEPLAVSMVSRWRGSAMMGKPGGKALAGLLRGGDHAECEEVAEHGHGDEPLTDSDQGVRSEKEG